MENKISVLTEVSDQLFHFTRTAIYSFLQHNSWFDGTIYLALHPDSKISDKNLAILTSIYPNISIVTAQSSPIFSHLASQKRSVSHFEILHSCLKTLAFNLPENRIIYFSNKSLFLKDVSSFLKPNSLVSADDSCSIFYTSLLDPSDVFLSMLENIQTLSIYSIDSVNSAINSTIVSSPDHIQNSLDFYQSSYFPNKKFNQLKTQLNGAKYLSFDSMSTNRPESSKINSVWIQKNQEVTNFLSKPRVSNAATLKSLKAQIPAKTGPNLQYSTTRYSTQRLNSILGQKVLLDRSEVIKYLTNKSVCIVANSSDLLQYNYGAFIDSHDVVVRFNGYKIIPEKTGVKTSIHCVFRDYTGKHTPAAPIKIVVSRSRSQWMHSISSFHAKDAIYRNYQIIDFNYPSDGDLRRAKCSNIPLPTSGICLYTYLVSLGMGDNIRLVGFNGYNGGNSNAILRENDDVNLASAHDYEKESAYWTTHFTQILPSVLKSK